MGITEESTEKFISVSFQAASVTADLLLKVLQSLEDAMKRENQGKNMFNTEQGRQVEVKTGKMNLHDLSGKGPTDYIDISNKKDFKNIERQCKKHNIDYSVLKSKDSPPTYSIFFHTKDTNILKKMLEEAIKDIEKDLPEQEQPERGQKDQEQEQPEQEQKDQEQEKPEQEQKNQEQEQKDQEQEKPEQEQKDQEQEQPEREQKDQEQEKPEQEQKDQEQEQPEREQKDQEQKQPEQEQKDQEQEQPKQEQKDQEQAKEHPDEVDQPGANASEKNRETMGTEEREKEEPIKTPETETSMPVQSNEPKAPTTDSVMREEKKEAASRTEGDRQPDGRIDTDSKRSKSNEKKLADEEREAATASREAKLSANEPKQATPGNRYSKTFEQLNKDLKNKVEREKKNPSIPQVGKHKEHGSLEM